MLAMVTPGTEFIITNSVGVPPRKVTELFNFRERISLIVHPTVMSAAMTSSSVNSLISALY